MPMGPVSAPGSCACVFYDTAPWTRRAWDGNNSFVNDSALSPSNLLVSCNVQQPEVSPRGVVRVGEGGRGPAATTRQRMKESRPVSVEPESTGQPRPGRYRVTPRCTCRCAISRVPLSAARPSVRPQALVGAISSFGVLNETDECLQNTRSQHAESPCGLPSR